MQCTSRLLRGDTYLCSIWDRESKGITVLRVMISFEFMLLSRDMVCVNGKQINLSWNLIEVLNPFSIHWIHFESICLFVLCYLFLIKAREKKRDLIVLYFGSQRSSVFPSFLDQVASLLTNHNGRSVGVTRYDLYFWIFFRVKEYCHSMW